MPRLHRNVATLLADHQDAVSTNPVHRERFAREERRCERCECVLASDNVHPVCSPCQRVLGGMPEHLSVYGSEKPVRRY